MSTTRMLAAASVNVLRLLSADETRQIQSAGVTRVFNYGYIIRRSAAPHTADGVVTVAWSWPLLNDRTQNPATLSVLIVALRQTP